MKRLVLLTAALLAFAGAASASDPSGSDPQGRWITQSGNLEVEVAPCGQALCGTVVRVIANHSMSRAGEQMKPADTRDPMGMKVLIDFVPSEFAEAGGRRVPTEWRGQIYNRENAKTYRCIMTLGESGEMWLHAYVGLPLFGKSVPWRRAEVSVGEARRAQ
jgi:uncharacterized protein (DUF2147 family)